MLAPRAPIISPASGAGDGLADMTEGAVGSLRSFRKPEPLQSQIPALGRDLGRTGEAGPPRAFGGLIPAVPGIR
jgi:hypothetical protein